MHMQESTGFLPPKIADIPTFPGYKFLINRTLNHKGLPVGKLTRENGQYEIQAFQKKGKAQWTRAVPPNLLPEVKDIHFRVYNPTGRYIAHIDAAVHESATAEKTMYVFETLNHTIHEKKSYESRVIEETVVGLLHHTIDAWVSSPPVFLSDDAKHMYANLKDHEEALGISVETNERGQFVVTRRGNDKLASA